MYEKLKELYPMKEQFCEGYDYLYEAWMGRSDLIKSLEIEELELATLKLSDEYEMEESWYDYAHRKRAVGMAKKTANWIKSHMKSSIHRKKSG